ncbi:kinesin-like protein KIF19 [Nilaparvata lugens]|uniref:kinesin-like protein KIF19 n=1 Tax=Nilaparvata lugens TaxID=108931 RepID=UPI00193D486A|nr:kinesin-like protein KIF19 [Nilaparvata lugens]
MSFNRMEGVDGAEESDGSKTMEEKLVVAVRVRPLKQDEAERCLHCVDDKTVILDENELGRKDVLRQNRAGQRQFIYDVVFDEESTQETVYDATTRGLVRDVLLGYNATVFAYGATGSGKTHTMVGDPSQPGIMVRALNDLFLTINNHGHKFTVTMSYLEIYNENIRDLLNPSSGFLDLREDTGRSRNITVAGLTEVTAKSTQEVMQLLQRGNRERSVEPTAANKTSSRSHALLSVTVRRTAPTPSNGGTQFQTRTCQGKLYMLDLAGSERASQTKNRGKRLLEGAHINRSLLALGNCINALSGGGSRYVNYRDSKLTRLLREALSGNCRTVMIAHVSPATGHREESRNTLIYAARASGISHKVERNVLDVSFHVSQYRSIIQDLRAEISRLRAKMTEERPASANDNDDQEEHKYATINDDNNNNDELNNNNSEITPNKQIRSGGHTVKQLRELIVSTFREQMKLRRRLMDIDGHLLSLGVEAERQHQIISQWESQHNRLYHRHSSGSDWMDNGDLNIHQAWSELSYIEREQERYVALRSATVRDLDNCRQRAALLENELPSKLDSDTEREMLSLLCRVHELEADKMALQGERLVENHELRRRGELLQRFHRQQKICEDIISRQRQLMEESRISLPGDLQDLYSQYQKEIHATSLSLDTAGVPYTAYDVLPPVPKDPDPLFETRLNSTTTQTQTASSQERERERHKRSGIEADLSLRTPTGSSTASYEWESGFPPLHTSANQKPAPLESSMRIPPPVLFPPITSSYHN